MNLLTNASDALNEHVGEIALRTGTIRQRTRHGHGVPRALSRDRIARALEPQKPFVTSALLTGIDAALARLLIERV